MPPEELEKVMAYYENLKNPKNQKPTSQKSIQSQASQENAYQRKDSNKKSDTPSIQNIERRESFKPK